MPNLRAALPRSFAALALAVAGAAAIAFHAVPALATAPVDQQQQGATGFAVAPT